MSLNLQSEKDFGAEHSSRIFWVVQTVFAVALSKAVLDYKECFLKPFSEDNYLTTLTLIITYVTALWSWVDYSYSLIIYPYNFYTKDSFFKRLPEVGRFIIDLVIVFFYASLVMSVSILRDDKSSDISCIPLYFLLIWVGYLMVGLLRIKQHGPDASRWGLLILFSLIYGLIYELYNSFYRSSVISHYLLNIITIMMLGATMVVYRMIRYRKKTVKKTIGVDVDGVLCNQITNLLPIIKKDYGISLEYSDIKKWDLSIADTNIASIIRHHLANKKYILSLPAISGAVNSIKRLRSKYNIVICTARTKESDFLTKKWLNKNHITYDGYENLQEEGKHLVQNDLSVLIDDYIGNIEGFLKGHTAKVIMFSQPWNSKYDHLDHYIKEGRMAVAENWDQVEEILARWENN